MRLDSRRYHRDRRPRFVRAQASGGMSQSSSNPVMFDPFGGQPFRTSQAISNQFTNPMLSFFGYGGGPHSPYTAGAGPLGMAMGQSTGPLSSYLPSMENLSTTLSSGANSAFGGYQAAIDNFMKQLPGFNTSAGAATSGATDALGYAKTAAENAFNPNQSNALYQHAATSALDAMRPGEAARGMVEGGQAAGGEASMLGNLAFQKLQADQQNQQGAISGLGGAASNLAGTTGQQANIAGLGPQAMQSLFAAYPQLASLLTGAGQLPFQSVGNLMNFFQSMQNPAMSLLSLIKPQMGQKSSSFSFNQSAGV